METTEDADILKNVVLHCVATDFANIVLPVPGGPNSNTPRHGYNIPVNKCGYLSGNDTAYFNNLLASSRPTISVNLTLGFYTSISRCKYAASYRYYGTSE